MIGSGTSDDPYRPDIPEGLAHSVVEVHKDGTVTVAIDSDPAERIAALEARLDAVAALAEQASTTAQEVARVVAAGKPTGR